MGIKGLAPFLKARAPSCFRDVPLKDFKDTRVAVDGNNWIHKSVYQAAKTVVELADLYTQDISRPRILQGVQRGALDFCIKMMKHGITPVFIFDGPPPLEKSGTKEKRIAEKEKLATRISDLTIKIRGCSTRFMIESKDMIELRNLLTRVDYVSSDMIMGVMQLLDMAGIPVLRSTTEGEKLCAQLAIEGKVCSVWSTDSDNWMFGTPLTLKLETTRIDDSAQFIIVSLELILEQLGLSHTEFIDFCICCGIDYNENFPGVGPVKAFDLIKTYRSIDLIPFKEWVARSTMKKKLTGVTDISCLKHNVCRKLSASVPSEQLCATTNMNLNYNLSKNLANRAKLCEIYPACSTYFPYMDFILQTNGRSIEDIRSYPVSRFTTKQSDTPSELHLHNQ